jgi:hypothetical protein
MPPQQTPEMPKPVSVIPPPTIGATQAGPKPKIKVETPNVASYTIDPYREPLEEPEKGTKS